MYHVEIIDSQGSRVGPDFWTGEPGDEYRTLKDAIEAANGWIEDQEENPEDYRVKWQIVGCL